MPAATPSSPSLHPPLHFPFLRLVVALLLLLCFAPSTIECSSLLSSLDLLVDVDRISALGFADIFQSYLLVQPNVTITSQIKTSQPSIADVASNAVDFGIISTGLTAAQASLYPQMQAFPVLCRLQTQHSARSAATDVGLAPPAHIIR